MSIDRGSTAFCLKPTLNGYLTSRAETRQPEIDCFWGPDGSDAGNDLSLNVGQGRGGKRFLLEIPVPALSKRHRRWFLTFRIATLKHLNCPLLKNNRISRSAS